MNQFLSPPLNLDPHGGPDGCCTVETFDPSDRRGTLEILRCTSESGDTEFDLEVARVETLHAAEKDAGSTVVRLMDPSLLELKRRQIS